MCLWAGLPVPPGFALHADLVVRVARGQLSANERAALERHLEQLGDAGLAVRSSASGEDGASGSFAGQHARIAELGIACERLFGAGQDIEWTLAGGNTYLLQARPVPGL